MECDTSIRSAEAGMPGSQYLGASLKRVASSLVWSLVLMSPFVGGWGWMMYADWRRDADARQAILWASQAYERLVAEPAAPVVSSEAASHGRDIFAVTCATCHGQDGRGMPRMGRNLVESDFVAARDDGAMKDFLLAGRLDALPMPMPPKGGRDDLTETDLLNVVAYLRGLQDPRRMPELAAFVPPAPPAVTETDKAAALAAAGGDAELAEYIASGNKLFHTTCVACHGKGGVGMPKNGKSLINNAFVQSLDDDGMLAFVKVGRSPTDPKNTTGIQMPPKGGNPALSDDDLLDIISYLRTLQPASARVASQAAPAK
ncbi:MAG: cytochrome c [Phycisphaerales bacterium]